MYEIIPEIVTAKRIFKIFINMFLSVLITSIPFLRKNNTEYQNKYSDPKYSKDVEIQLSSSNLEFTYNEDTGFFAPIKYAITKTGALFKQMFITVGSLFEIKEFIDTLKLIFGEKVNICKQCNICSIYKYKENSLNTITLIKPLYKVNVELDYGNVLEKKTFEVTHDFIGWSNYGDGVLNNNTYKFGFENSKLVANWKYNSLVLPDLSNIESDKIFVGWYKDPNYKEFIGKNISYIPLSNQTLYAYWASYKKADINDDALIDITDLVILRQYLAEIVLKDKINVLAADINEDGNVDITDLIILRKHLAGLEEIN